MKHFKIIGYSLVLTAIINCVILIFAPEISHSYVSYNMIDNSSFNARAAYDNVNVLDTLDIMLFLLVLTGIFFQLSKKSYSILRKILDVFVSMMIIVITFPLMVLIAILIKINSPGPIFYKQKRVGMNHRKNSDGKWELEERRHENKLGGLFTIYKLRTMYVGSESSTGARWAQENDNRITRVGKFLRKTHLDEFPQFFNILKGEMSLIGPRPERPEFVKLLNDNILYYYRRYSIKPGLTGLAQVRYHYTSSLTDTRNKIKYDLLYLRNWCFFMDLKIFFNTFSAVLFGKGAR